MGCYKTANAAKLVFYKRQPHNKTFSVTCYTSKACGWRPRQSLLTGCCWKTDACVGVFLLPVFVAFSQVFSSVFCSRRKPECSPETSIEFCPCSDLNGTEFVQFMLLVTSLTCVRLCASASTHRKSLPLQTRYFRYFLLNAVTYGPVLYLLSAMQLL